MICKKFSNTGLTGHAMQEVDMLKRRLIEEKLNAEKIDLSVCCGNGCEFIILGDEERMTVRDSFILSKHVRENNLCPFCKKDEHGRQNFEYAVENQNKMFVVKFEILGQAITTMYKPNNYRFLPPELTDGTEKEK